MPVTSEPDGAQRGGGVVDGLVLAPGGLASGAVRRSGPLEHRTLKPERDKLVVGGTVGWLSLDQAEPLADGEGLLQELRALDPRGFSSNGAGSPAEDRRSCVWRVGGLSPPPLIRLGRITGISSDPITRIPHLG